MPGPNKLTPEQYSWQLAHSSDNSSHSILAACSITPALAAVFIALRVWSKRLLYGRFRLEINDWLCIVAWPVLIAGAVLYGLATQYGLGRHVIFVSDPRLLQILVIAAENLYALDIALLKLSILSLYQKLFKQYRWFYRSTWIVGFLVIAFGLCVILTSNLQCIPLAATWDPTIEATCINLGLSSLITYIANITIEIVILTMPIPAVLKLKVSRRRKWMLILTFATGGSACIVSLVQLKYILRFGSNSDPTWENSPAIIVGLVEITIGILAVSISTYRPLYQHFSRSGAPLNGSDHEAKGSAVDRYTDVSYTARVLIDSSAAVDAQFHGILATDQIELVRHTKQGGTWVQIDDGQP
ncbi:hypothetical protein F4777DRAFT_542691 [Nemania sp. FL0916]|nr:hypothetical protein F4777DRAFT_542691 [Nemania sp. FL0916]